MFGFTGEPPDAVVRDNADRTLRDLDAEDIQTSTPLASLVPGVTAVRAKGYVVAAGRRVWAQYSTYVVGSTTPSKGRLIQQTILTGADCRDRLAEDIACLSNDLQQALLKAIDGG